jgi:hypothetical protein
MRASSTPVQEAEPAASTGPKADLVITTSERLRVVRASLESLADTFRQNTDAGLGAPHDLLCDAASAVEALRDFAQDTERNAVPILPDNVDPPPSTRVSHLRSVK